MASIAFYVVNSIDQHVERGKRLLGRIPAGLPSELYLLAQTCTNELNRIFEEFNQLKNDPLEEQLRRFQRAVYDLSIVETIGLPALERYNSKDDIFLNRLIHKIKNEIQYPLLPPVVTSLSQDYFHIYMPFNLLFVPLSEGDSLLHLPDLYHEIAHPLLVEDHDRRVEPFKKAWLESYSLIIDYFHNEIIKEERRNGPESFKYYLNIWKRTWAPWLMEFYCDLFGVFSIGPAYAWAHFHLCAKMGNNPFAVSMDSESTHPADNARMDSMLYALNLCGYSQEAAQIKSYWDELTNAVGLVAEPEYHRCYPPHILLALTDKCFSGMQAMGCILASPQNEQKIYQTLNQAWVEFWKNPSKYSIWEKAAIEDLRNY